MASPVDNIRKGGGGGRRIGETGSVIHRLLLLRRFPSARHKFGKQVFHPPSLPFLLRGIEFSTVPSVPTSTPKDTSAPFAQHYKTALKGGREERICRRDLLHFSSQLFGGDCGLPQGLLVLAAAAALAPVLVFILFLPLLLPLPVS